MECKSRVILSYTVGACAPRETGKERESVCIDRAGPEDGVSPNACMLLKEGTDFTRLPTP